MDERKAPVDDGLGDLEPGTRQRTQLRVRVADIAWTAACAVLALWAVWTAIDLARGATAWAYCAVAWLLLAVALTVRVMAVRRRTSL
ncbi:hypothetical protein ACN6LC_006716 [Streptomyces violaceoruber]|uniref:Integral membrane protein n=5 Tax=Streptomyces TaxID=1883 RepID=Q9L128_STRCO|nr:MULTISPECIES: hypothetical protein [Streptomyces]MYU46935.1 hypothetical protein [Streptomyces sp. SID7813]QSJ06962.1 putative membrane protein [Streptomyces lividans]AIJ11459.1 putative membrane protein [Streptomyces lividans TK24]KKD14362.1 hypothetical protein TR66_15795 [Streptomyces sp. WM6391]MBQ0948694.1 hypothetical protein [Streptomyces sp. RK76]